MDLADFLAAKLAQSNYRDMEDVTKVSRGSLESIIKRQNTKLPELETLEKIGNAYGLPLWHVIEMAGKSLGDEERYSRLARELQTSPWITNRWTELLRMTPEDLDEAMDYLAFRRKQRGPLPPTDDQSNP